MSTTFERDHIAVARRDASRLLLWLDGGVIVGAAVAAVLAHAAASLSVPAVAAPTTDPALSRLLLGMTFVKLAFVVAMAALSVWRFRRPLGTGLALGYLACVWASTAATVLIWQSAWLGFASVLFHGAGLAFMVVALRDDCVLPLARRRG